MIEQVNITGVFNNFCQITGARVRVLRQEFEYKNQQIDAEIELKTGIQKNNFLVEQKTEIREGGLPRLLQQMRPRQNWLLAAQYIPATIKEECRKTGINYVEAAGNCYIRTEGTFLFINDQAVTPHRLVKEGKLWKTAGIKFLFAVLQLPAILDLPQRRLAYTAGVALGNIGPFMDELEENGFIEKGYKDKKQNIVLQNKEELMRKWVELYNAVLKPKLKRGKFRFANEADWKKRAKLMTPDMYWGGEPGGAELTNQLTPEKYLIYTNETTPQVMKTLKVLPDENGNVEILEAFWNTDVYAVIRNTVPPLIAYADLANDLDSRNRQAAEIIKEKYL